MRRLAAGALLLAATSLCAPARADVEASASDRAPASVNPMRALGRDAFKRFVDAPLFDPSRRLPPVVVAPPPPPPIAPPPPEPPPALHVVGVIYGGSNVAIVRVGDETAARALHTGDKLGAWTVAVQQKNGIRLTRGDRAFDYAMFAAGPSTGGAGAARVRSATGGASLFGIFFGRMVSDGVSPDGSSAAVVAVLAARRTRLQARTY